MLWNIVKEKLKHGPVVLNDSNGPWVIHGVDEDGSYHWNNLGYELGTFTYIESLMKGMVDNDPYCLIGDYFGEEEKKVVEVKKRACTCDFYSVIIPYGCKCGGT
jgi:hypothetical protein